MSGPLCFLVIFYRGYNDAAFYSKEVKVIYLTSKQEEALSPVKREVYQRRLMRDLERRQEEAIRRVEVKVPKYTPISAGIANCIIWVESSRLEALAAAVAMELQKSEQIKNEVASLYEEES